MKTLTFELELNLYNLDELRSKTTLELGRAGGLRRKNPTNEDPEKVITRFHIFWKITQPILIKSPK